ncbi:MAG TPA: DCC1-like thiol-disulfide oxidoreductase family protein [Paludibacter sp.]|nr:DCC1-like thiol-disulfide oxidoreductase family protein [Paludibacter sp.]
MNEQRVILFDGVCNLCCYWVHFLIRNDKKELFLFAQLQSGSAKRILESLGLNSNDFETVVYIKNNICLQKSSAVLEILTDLGGVWKIVGVFKLIPNVIRDFIYRFIANIRYKVFGKRESCMLPSTKIQKRFLT